MKVSVEVELAPFKVPDSVSVKGTPALKQHGFTAQRKMHLSELSREALEKLCDDFQNEVFKKAGKYRTPGVCGSND